MLNIQVWHHSWYKVIAIYQVPIRFAGVCLWELAEASAIRIPLQFQGYACSALACQGERMKPWERCFHCFDLRLCADLHHTINGPVLRCLGVLHHCKWLLWEVQNGCRDGLCQGCRLRCYTRRNCGSSTVQQRTFNPVDMVVSSRTFAKFPTVLVEMGVILFPLHPLKEGTEGAA